VNDSISAAQQESSSASTAGVRCPACGATDDYVPAIESRGSFSWLVFLAGGIFAVMFRNAGRRKKLRCNKCGALFEIRTPLSRLSLVLFWLLIGPTIIGLVCLLGGLLYAIFEH
jgi:hypothetical protein